MGAPPRSASSNTQGQFPRLKREGLLAEPFGLLTACGQDFYGLAAMAAISACVRVDKAPMPPVLLAIAFEICVAVLGFFPFAPWQPLQFAL
jgi:hypothetical protein